MTVSAARAVFAALRVPTAVVVGFAFVGTRRIQRLHTSVLGTGTRLGADGHAASLRARWSDAIYRRLVYTHLASRTSHGATDVGRG